MFAFLSKCSSHMLVGQQLRLAGPTVGGTVRRSGHLMELHMKPAGCLSAQSTHLLHTAWPPSHLRDPIRNACPSLPQVSSYEGTSETEDRRGSSAAEGADSGFNQPHTCTHMHTCAHMHVHTCMHTGILMHAHTHSCMPMPMPMDVVWNEWLRQNAH